MDKKEVAIGIYEVSKSFKQYSDKGNSLKEKVIFRERNRFQNKNVLDHITLDIAKGETVGLIGENGCGKSTLLKMISKILYPNEGTIEINGRVSSLIELGAGFHPDMTGRENIYINASIFGLNKRDIDEKIEDIIAFSELESAIDAPIRTYSSGMYMRLAFSVAIHVQADILIIDEILAVGDVSFQKKCFEKLKEIKRVGITIVIVSHSLGTIENLCDRFVWLENGVIRNQGKPGEIHPLYLEAMEKKRLDRIEFEFEQRVEKEEAEAETEPAVNEAAVSGKAPEEASEEMSEAVSESTLQTVRRLTEFNGHPVIRQGNGKACIRKVIIFSGNSVKPKVVFQTGETVEIRIEYRCETESQVKVGMRIYREDEVYCYGSNSLIEGLPYRAAKQGEERTAVILAEPLALLAGKYMLDVELTDEKEEVLDSIHNAVEFHMAQDKYDSGVFRLNTEWRV